MMPRSPDAFTDAELAELPVKQGFRLRGMEMTRTETFTDAAFAFAVTLLVVSIDAVPSNYDELMAALKGVPAFAASFSLLLLFWAGHWRWSRRFGMEDGMSILLSALLVFMVLVYVYPLKFLTSLFMFWISGGTLSTGAALEPGREAEQLHSIFAVYGTGFVLMTAVVILLNLHALRQRQLLRINTVEAATTRAEVESWVILGGVGLVSVLLAVVLPPTRLILPGWIYCLLPVLMPLHGVISGKRVERIIASQSARWGSACLTAQRARQTASPNRTRRMSRS